MLNPNQHTNLQCCFGHSEILDSLTVQITFRNCMAGWQLHK